MVLAAFKQTGKRAAIQANYRLGHYKEAIWLVGDGRSGTTWVSNIINWHGQYREMFEPFHPALIEECKSAKLHQYLKPNEANHEIVSILHSIFTGKFYHPRPDALNKQLIYQGLLVKDIFANLLIGWVCQNIPHLKTVWVIRNPFAVALSKQKRTRGIWMNEPSDFLTQPDLVDDYIAPFQDAILSIGDDFIERQLLIWAIIHYVPLQQIKTSIISKSDIYILFYEDLFNAPHTVVQDLFSYLFEAPQASMDNRLMSKINQPSQSPGKDSNIMLGKSPVDTWKNELSVQQINKGLQILELFGLGELYGDSSMPDKEALGKSLT